MVTRMVNFAVSRLILTCSAFLLLQQVPVSSERQDFDFEDSLFQESNGLSEEDLRSWNQLTRIFPEVVAFNPRLAKQHVVESRLTSEKAVEHYDNLDYTDSEDGGRNYTDSEDGITNATTWPIELTLNSTNVTCYDDLYYTFNSLDKGWSFKMIDAFGKMRPGLTRGAINWIGNFDLCQDVVAESSEEYQSGGFRGRYCSAGVNIPKMPMPVRFGLCVPSTCNATTLGNIDTYLENTYNFSGKIPEVWNLVKNLTASSGVICAPNKDEVTYNAGTIVCIVLIAITFAAVIVASIYDVYLTYFESRISRLKPPIVVVNGSASAANETDYVNKEVTPEDTSLSSPLIENEEPKGIAIEILMAFSVLGNAPSILDTKVKEGQLNCLHGVRFLSLSWVILGHTYVMGIASFENIIDVVGEVNTYSFQALLQATFSVDTFFLLSGFLLTYLFLKEQTPMTWGKWVYFYVHRYVRLTPVYMMVLFFYTTWFNYLGDGPLWNYADRVSNICTKTWWWNLLYINNFKGMTDMCLAWGWYLANDMQFFVISPIFLIPLKSPRYRFLGFAIILVLLFTCWLTTGLISSINEFSVAFNGIDGPDGAAGVTNSFDALYTKPWTRIGPYLIGAFIAYGFMEARRCARPIHWLVVTLGWCIASILNIVVVYGLYHATPGVHLSALYNAVARSVWALSVAWVIFACLTNNGGPVNKILSWPLWFPLSRLTYCAYLIHPMILYWCFGTMRGLYFYTRATTAVYFLGFMLLTYGLAFVVSLVYEAPVIKIEKILRTR